MKFAFFIFISIVVSSCAINRTKLIVPDCPIDTAFCTPQPHTVPQNTDTTKAFFDRNGYCFKIEPVKGIITRSDEFAIAFNHQGKAFLTQNNEFANQVLELKRYSVNNFERNLLNESAKEFNIGFVSFSSKEVLISKSPIGNNFGDSRIYISSNLSYDEKNLKLIEFDDVKLNGIWISQPCFACDGDIMLFASDLDTSYGGTDLFISKRLNEQKFSSPINLGRNVNTDCDELTPFVDPSNKFLMFSSNGRDNVGGYDLFISQLAPDFCAKIKSVGTNVSDLFGQAENLGRPINTVHDEISPAIYPGTDSALYFASNQKINDSVNQDFNIWVKYVVYDYTTTEPSYTDVTKIIDTDKPEINLKKEIIVQGKVFDAETNLLLDSVLMVLRKVPYEQPEQMLFTDKSGAYKLKMLTDTEYEITAQKPGYYFDTKRIIIDNKDKIPELNFYLPHSGAIRVNFPLDEYLNPYKFTLDSNGNQTSRTWQEELDLVAENILLTPDKIDKVILVGHTDDIGTDEYNIQLGQRRVEFIIEELVKRNVPRKILIGRSAGENEPLLRKSEEAIDTYRKRLRRVIIDKFYK